MAFFEINGELLNIVLVALGIALVAGVVVVAVFKIIQSNREEARRKAACNQAVADAVEKAFMEIRKEYLVMSRNTTYTVGGDGEIAMGRYVLKSSVSTQKQFNIRLNGLVEQYHEGDIVTLGGGDTICAVSGTVLIKPYVDDLIDNQ